MIKLSFVIPCYRSESTISFVVDEIIATVNKRQNYDYEIILVSDCSPDNVYSVITELAQNNNKIIGLELSRNFGQHAALMAGYRHCTGDIIISLDDDGQPPATEMFSLIDKLEEGFDVVYGSYKDKKQSMFRIFGSYINRLMSIMLLDMPKTLETTSYFACKKYILAEIIHYNNPYPYIAGLIFRTTKNITSVAVEHRPRQNGRSGYSLKKLISLWMNGFTAFSIKPLRISTIIGVLVSLFGFIFGIYTIIHKLINPLTPAGYSSIMAVMLFLGGIILMMLGLIGEYIGRIYISINNSPQYVIKRMTNSDYRNDDLRLR